MHTSIDYTAFFEGELIEFAGPNHFTKPESEQTETTLQVDFIKEYIMSVHMKKELKN